MNTEKEFDWYAFARKLGEMKDQIGECIEIVDKLKANFKPKTFRVEYEEVETGHYHAGTVTRTERGLELETDFECSDRIYNTLYEKAMEINDETI